MFVLLTLLSALVVVAFLSVVTIYLLQIARTLESIGGAPDSFLAKLRLGLRAIESETGHLPGEVARLNENLSAVHESLEHVDEHLDKTIEAVTRQEVQQ